ncbi:MAG: oligosaccharide flippase family protein [Acidobacteriota bacterium]
MSTLEETARKLVSSAGAATVSQVWRLAVTFLTHMALRRMLGPEELGPWFWAEPLFIILAQVRDLGVPGHIVREEERPYGNFLRLQISWGFLFTGLVFFCAPLIAGFYEDTSAPIVDMVRALCVFLVVQGLGAVAMIYFEAELEVIKTIPAELARNAVFAVLSLGLAWRGHGVWSIVIGHIAAAGVFAAMLWWAAWKEKRVGRLSLRVLPKTGRLVWVSLPLMVMAVLEQLVLKLDAFILALRFPSEVVGTAGLAIYAVFFFSRLLADPVGRALYPALVRYADRPARAFEAFRLATVLLASMAAPLAFFLYVNAELAALFLGGEEWVGAADYLRFLSLVPLIRPLAMFGLELLLTRHMDRLLILYTFANLVSLGTLGWFLVQTDLGANGMAIAGYFPLGILFLAWGIHRMSPPGFGVLLRQLAELYLVSAVLFVPLAYALSTDALALRFAFSAVAGLAALGWAWKRFGSAFLGFLKGNV